MKKQSDHTMAMDRIAACLDACQDVPNESLAKRILLGHMAELAKVNKQLDSANEELFKDIVGLSHCNDMIASLKSDLDSLIASVRGLIYCVVHKDEMDEITESRYITESNKLVDEIERRHA